MKSNIFIIIAVVLAALGVIALVIIISQPSDSGTPSDFHNSSDSISVPYDSDNSHNPSDNSSNRRPGDGHSSEVAKNIVAMAYSLINTPYVENGASPDGFDNSGFIYYVMRKNGFLTCPRGTIAQSEWGARQTYENLAAGDLVFFSDDGQSDVSFGGIYAGNGEMIACITHNGESKVWSVDITTDYYRRNFVRGIAIS